MEEGGSLVAQRLNRIELCHASGLLSNSMTRERVVSLLEDNWRKRYPTFQEPKLSEHLALVEPLRTIAAKHGLHRLIVTYRLFFLGIDLDIHNGLFRLVRLVIILV
jgi:hypothetical protein